MILNKKKKEKEAIDKYGSENNTFSNYWPRNSLLLWLQRERKLHFIIKAIIVFFSSPLDALFFLMWFSLLSSSSFSFAPLSSLWLTASWVIIIFVVSIISFHFSLWLISLFGRGERKRGRRSYRSRQETWNTHLTSGGWWRKRWKVLPNDDDILSFFYLLLQMLKKMAIGLINKSFAEVLSASFSHTHTDAVNTRVKKDP